MSLTPERAGPDDPAAGRGVGWREVLAVSFGVVAVVLGAAVLTGYLPTGVQRLIFHAPTLIVVLVVGTIVVLWGVARRRPPEG